MTEAGPGHAIHIEFWDIAMPLLANLPQSPEPSDGGGDVPLIRGRRGWGSVPCPHVALGDHANVIFSS